MKKVILALVIATGSFAFANAQGEAPVATQTETVAAQEGYKTVSVGDLSPVVQEAIKTIAGDTCEVKTVEFDAAKELTKVTFVVKADNSEKVVVLNKEGK